MKKGVVLLAAALCLVMFAGLASAHVTVRPFEATQGAYEVFSVRVPSETTGTETVKVEVKIPDGANITRVEPKAGWTHTLERDGEDRIIAVAWSAEGAGLAVTEFTEFRLSGRVLPEATELVWRAYQSYADGSIVEWIGASDSDKPASVTKVNASDAAADDRSHGGHDTGAAEQFGGESGTAETADSAVAESGNALATILSVVAVVLAAAALIISIVRRKA